MSATGIATRNETRRVARSGDQTQQRRSKATQCIVTTMIDSPVGPLLAGATDDGICLLEFTHGSRDERSTSALRRWFGVSIEPGDHKWLELLREELAEYFAGRLKKFTVPLVLRGTPFQEMAWRELSRIPFGKTISYAEQALRIGRPTSVRAVANANGQNRIAIVIPCHRVIGKDGSLTGFGGGLWRKQLLLDLETRQPK